MQNITHYQSSAGITLGVSITLSSVYYICTLTKTHHSTQKKSESESLLRPSGLLNFISVFSSINQGLQCNNKSV